MIKRVSTRKYTAAEATSHGRHPTRIRGISRDPVDREHHRFIALSPIPASYPGTQQTPTSTHTTTHTHTAPPPFRRKPTRSAATRTVVVARGVVPGGGEAGAGPVCAGAGAAAGHALSGRVAPAAEEVAGALVAGGVVGAVGRAALRVRALAQLRVVLEEAEVVALAVNAAVALKVGRATGAVAVVRHAVVAAVQKVPVLRRAPGRDV